MRACTAPLDALLRHTGRVRCTPDPCAESFANLYDHRTQAIGRTLSVRCSPDSCAERVAKPPTHRTLSTGLSPVRPVHSAAPDSTPDDKGQRPVPPHRASGEKHSRDFSKLPTGAIENMHLIFSKACKCKECQHQQVYTTMCKCVSFSQTFPKGVSVSNLPRHSILTRMPS